MSLPHNHINHKEIKEIPCIDNFKPVAQSFKLLDDPTRLRIFWILCHSEECVINLASIMNMSSPAIAHHLRKLKDCDLIISRKDGKEVYYQANSTLLVSHLHSMIEDIMHIHCPN